MRCPKVAADAAANAIYGTMATMFCCVDLLLTRLVKDLPEWMIASSTCLGQFCLVVLALSRLLFLHLDIGVGPE